MRHRSKLYVVMVLLIGTLTFCYVPFARVSSIYLTLLDQDGQQVTEATAIFFDDQGKKIVDISDKGNTINWWASNQYTEKSLLSPDDALRARTVRIDAEKCDTLVIPVALESNYNAPSIMPHGGGSAYLLHKMEQTIQLQCR